jgi:hypothetical protein
MKLFDIKSEMFISLYFPHPQQAIPAHPHFLPISGIKYSIFQIYHAENLFLLLFFYTYFQILRHILNNDWERMGLYAE